MPRPRGNENSQGGLQETTKRAQLRRLKQTRPFQGGGGGGEPLPRKTGDAEAIGMDSTASHETAWVLFLLLHGMDLLDGKLLTCLTYLSSTRQPDGQHRGLPAPYARRDTDRECEPQIAQGPVLPASSPSETLHHGLGVGRRVAAPPPSGTMA